MKTVPRASLALFGTRAATANASATCSVMPAGVRPPDLAGLRSVEDAAKLKTASCTCRAPQDTDRLRTSR